MVVSDTYPDLGPRIKCDCDKHVIYSLGGSYVSGNNRWQMPSVLNTNSSAAVTEKWFCSHLTIVLDYRFMRRRNAVL